ncbi:alpha/beta fold hydrolase [Streptomyces hainanensis]|uniref:Alpha/beta hydrolase n=1 Tax=Streptomyces hainanensis TaxID=402648 RepID=A0A4R4TNN6_9ACTN|nr:alpha/beta hydrolase [Streptomyces hainanensis]TDC78316.1 alpha/beta hydrolase [Streptomyces hainanensis]
MGTTERPHVREWRNERGDGDRTAVLLHGLSGSSATWWRLGPWLAERHGYRVLAPDLAGHGRSARAASYSRERWADDLLDVLPAGPELAIGHSLGGVLLAMVADRLRPARAVYEDPAWYPWSGAGYGEVQPAIRAFKRWTAEDVRAAHPTWSDEAVGVRLAELRDWDPETTRMRYLETAHVPVFPVVPSLVLLADPSDLTPPPLADHFEEVGFVCRTVPGAGHFAHVDDPDGFLAALGDWA